MSARAPGTYRGRVRTRRGLALIVPVATLVVAMAGTPAAAASGPTAKPAWSMVPMSKDANGDGFIDGDGGVPRSGAMSLQPSRTFVGAGNGIAQPHERLIGGSLSWYLDAAGYPVRLDACGSSGTSYSWTITGPSDSRTTPARALKKKTCKTTVLLPEGAHTLTLTVTKGGTSATESVQADVRNILVVAMGDSYASGVGNPRNVDAWLRASGLFTSFDPYWDDDACDRSVRGAPAQAALALEKSSPRTSVTLVNVTCGGATIGAGIIGPQRSARQAQSQIEQVRGIIGGRPIDIVTLSIGGNDIGFAQVLAGCATDPDCAIRPVANPPLRGYPTMQQGIQALTGALPAGYAQIAGCLGGSSCPTGAPLAMAPGARILPTMYPDITRAADGGPCTYLTFTSGNMRWARDTMLVPGPAPTYEYATSNRAAVTLDLPNGSLNQQIAATDQLGWRPVVQTWAASGDSPVGHGICAGEQAWAYPITALSGFAGASFHPNPVGQQVAAQALLGAMRP